MNRLTFTQSPKLDTAIIIKQSFVWDTNKGEFSTNYFIPIGKHLKDKIGHRVAVLGSYHPKTGKVKKSEIVTFTRELLEYADMNGIVNLLVADGDYFKYLAGAKAFEKHIGERFACAIPDYEHMTVTPMINYATISMFPEKQPLLDLSNKTAAEIMCGVESSKDAFEFESYEMVTDPTVLKRYFDEYKEYDYIAADIETTGLYVGPTELLTIAFAKDKYNAFTIPLHSSYGYSEELWTMTKQFIIDCKGSQIYHNGLFDAKHIIYNMFMKDFSDIDGMLEGLNALQFDDTFIMAYLKLNSTVRPSLGLKDLAYDFLGDYAENVKDALAVPLEDLAVYNAKDVCGTYYVFELMRDAMDFDIYKDIMKPSFRSLLKMMINGMPLDLKKVDEVGQLLETDLEAAKLVLADDQYVKLVTKQLRIDASVKYNASHKVATKSPSDFSDLHFNPNSSNQLRMLLFDTMGFEPVDFTAAKAPKTDRASIKEFLELASFEQKPVLEALVTISQAGIVLNTFINAFKELSITQAHQHDDHIEYKTTLHGSLVLGGTQSGRLSSRDPNMQNLNWGVAA